MLAHEVQRETWLFFFSRELTTTDETAEAGPSGVVLRQEHEVIAIDELELGAEHSVKTALLRVIPETNGAVETVRVGERERIETELDRAIHELLRMRRAVEERVIAMGV